MNMNTDMPSISMNALELHTYTIQIWSERDSLSGFSSMAAGAVLDVVHAERSRIRMPDLAQTDLFLFDIQSQKPVAASTNLWFGK
jgi:hypothetical protein